MKLQALQQAGAQSPMPQQPMPQGMSPIPQQQDLVAPNAPSMNQQDAQSRMNAMIQAPATMQTVAAKLRAQADQDDADEQHANSLQDEDMSGYTNVPSTAQRQAAARQPAAQKFANLKAKIQQPQDVRDTLHGAVEVTPELEKQLGYGSDDDEDDNKNTRGSTKDTGTLGGV